MVNRYPWPSWVFFIVIEQSCAPRKPGAARKEGLWSLLLVSLPPHYRPLRAIVYSTPSEREFLETIKLFLLRVMSRQSFEKVFCLTCKVIQAGQTRKVSDRQRKKATGRTPTV